MGGGPLHILDEIEFVAGQRASFLAALEKRYRPQAEALGLDLRSLLLEPPVEIEGVASRALIRWELADVAAFWSWRFRGTTRPDLAAFWSDSAPQIVQRTRRYASDVAGLEPLARVAAAPRGRARIVPGLGRSVSLLRLRPDVSDAERETLERALESAAAGAFSSVARNLPGTMNGGDYTWDIAGASAAGVIDGLPASVRSLVDRCDEVELEPIAGGLRAPGIANPIKRTLLLRVLPDAAPAGVAAFEHALLAMPDHIDAIRNWCLSRARGSRKGWTHVWEQDFAEVSGLADDYMNHPMHWSVVDPWFHPEDPRCVVAPVIAHVFCRAQRSVLSHALAPA